MPEGQLPWHVRAIREDRHGTPWSGNSVQGHPPAPGRRVSRCFLALEEADVWAILEDRQGAVWYGPLGSGVCRYGGKTVVTYTMQNGLTTLGKPPALPGTPGV